MNHEEISIRLFERKYKGKGPFLNVKKVREFCDRALHLLFPELGGDYHHSLEEVSNEIKGVRTDLLAILVKLLPEVEATEVCESFIQGLKTVESKLEEDANAIFRGDPAARSLEEVIICYPGFFAIATYRTAHLLFGLGVPIVPRLLSEYAHYRTGIDIHPGAQIGCPFFIDHGTGVVIGETTVIGNNVKIYQGVTLGALSVSKSMASLKRHPTIGDHCIIYSNATILGGSTFVGKNSVIGGNVWLTKSVPENSLVYHESMVKLLTKKEEGDAP